MIEYYHDLIIEKGLNLELYSNLFERESWQEMFQLALIDDFVELIEYLYTNLDCKFYLNNYTKQMDQDLLGILNDDKGNERGFRLIYNKNNSDSFDYLLNMRRYSKLLKDKEGFYYIFSKK